MNPLVRLAIASGSHDSLRKLASRAGAVHARDSSGRTPLMLAAARGDHVACRILLDAGAELHATDAQGARAREHALGSGHRHLEALFFPAPSELVNTTSSPESSEDFPEEIAAEEAIGFDDWEAEVEPVLPQHSEPVVARAVEVQVALAEWAPEDDYADWDDDGIELPESALSNARRSGQLCDADITYLRLAIREGVETGRLRLGPVIDTIHGDDVARASELRMRMTSVCGDLGIVIEDDDSYPVGFHPDAHESEPMADLIDGALSTIDELGSNRSDPLVRFMKDASRFRLLTREDEQEIGRSVDTALDRCRIAIAEHPEATAAVIELIEQVGNGLVPPGRVTDAEVAPSSVDDSSVDTSAIAEDEEADDEGLSRADLLERFSEAAIELKRWTDRRSDKQVAVAGIERALARLDLRWSAFESVVQSTARQYPGLPQTFALADAMRALRTERDRLFHGNIRLVMSIARKYSRQALPLADLVQEGCIGLLKAVEKFDHRKGFKFSTYATWWVRQAMTRALADHGRSIRLPVHLVESLNVLRRIEREVEATQGRTPSASEIADRMSIPASRVERLLGARIDAVPFGDLAADEDLEAIPDSLPTPEEAATVIFMQQATRRLIRQTLDERQQEVVMCRFGIVDDRDMTLEEVGRLLGVTRERIRQIESKALKRLLRAARRKRLSWEVGACPDLDTSQSDLETPANENGEAGASETAEPNPDHIPPIRQERPAGFDGQAARTGPSLASVSESWVRAAYALALRYSLDVSDLRRRGDGMFIRLKPMPSDVRMNVVGELSALGFEDLDDLGFWRA